MKKIGLIGGIGPESSVAYYRLIIKRYQEILLTKDYPEIFINSINMTEMLGYVFNSHFDKLVDFLIYRIKMLEDAGIDFGAIASNTPHIVFEKLEEKANIPLISIVEETCKAIESKNLHRIGLLGTKSTMISGFYNKVGKKYKIDIISPGPPKQDYIHDKYMTELIFNKIIPETKERLLQIVNDLKEKESIEGLILGGTELPLILSQSDFKEMEIFDTTKIHVESIVKRIIEDQVS